MNLTDGMPWASINPVNRISATVPPLVRAKAESFGEHGRVWLDGLDELIAEMEQQWSITVGQPISGGNPPMSHTREPPTARMRF
jgi:hypothetical protein